MDLILLGGMVVIIILLVFNLVMVSGSGRGTASSLSAGLRDMAGLITENQKFAAETQDRRLAELSRQLSLQTLEHENRLEHIRNTMETRLSALQEDNNRKLEQMRSTVDEKLQQTLEERITKSFRIVNEQLEKVNQSFGQMQNLASGVGDLKRVLTNVKTRGNLGELQLEAILEQIMAPDQYEKNVRTKSSGDERVEFAVKLPGNGTQPVWLPIDAKYPGDTYERLLDAYESGDKEQIKRCTKDLTAMIRSEARDIRNKYIEPPYTTDFAILFLPVEGLYAEVVRAGMVEELQSQEYKINIAGPTTMAALLSSLQMGFRTLAIQRYSGEVWETLASVKTEFGKFGDILAKTRENLKKADENLEQLVGTRTRKINLRLRNVELTGDGRDKPHALDAAFDESDKEM